LTLTLTASSVRQQVTRRHRLSYS